MGGARPTPNLAILTTSGVTGRFQPLVVWLDEHRREIVLASNAAVLGITFGLFFLDRTLPRYVDESDNLLGGQLVARGYRLYVDFFSQHMPLPYFITALATLLGAQELVIYRTFFSVLVACVCAAVVVHFRRRLSSAFVYALVLTIGLGHPLFSGYMVLADHFFAFALMVIVLFVLAEDVTFSVRQQIAIALCCFVAIQSTLISVYPIGLMAAYYVVRTFVVLRGASTTWRAEARFAALLAVPQVLLLLVMLMQGTLGPLWEQAFVFNQQYYSRYDIGGDPIGILRNSVADFGGLVVEYLRPSAFREVETVLLVSNIAAVLVVWRRRGGLLGGLYVGLVVLSRMRGAGYHGSPYFVVSFVSMALVLALAWDVGARWAADWLRSEQGMLPGRLAWSRHVPIEALGLSAQAPPATPGWSSRVALRVVLVAYLALVGLFYHDLAGFYVRLPRGQELSSPYARVVSAITEPGDRLWAAPFEPDIYVETRRLPASPYWYYHAWLADSPQITAGVLRDLQAVRPPVVIFRADKQIPWSFPLPTPAEFGRSVYVYIQQAYVPFDAQDDVLRDVYLRRDLADVLRARLASAIAAPRS